MQPKEADRTQPTAIFLQPGLYSALVESARANGRNAITTIDILWLLIGNPEASEILETAGINIKRVQGLIEKDHSLLSLQAPIFWNKFTRSAHHTLAEIAKNRPQGNRELSLADIASGIIKPNSVPSVAKSTLFFAGLKHGTIAS
ncbi:MAG: hypothetical protein HY425_02715 [Candidatus Levybacteria bacterium]|nr:hypothetical protein [Candidatus Levybacteria bacterium]